MCKTLLFVMQQALCDCMPGRDIGSSLPALLWRLVDLLPEGTMMRLGMVLDLAYVTQMHD